MSNIDKRALREAAEMEIAALRKRINELESAAAGKGE